MATTVLKDAYIGMTDYNADGYHKAYYRCGGISYDSVTRSGNTVTLTNVKVKAYVQFVRTNGNYFGYTAVFYDWIGIWDSSSTTASGTAPIAKTTQFKNNTSNTRYYDTPHTVRTGDLNIGNISFTVSGDGSGSKTFKVGLAFGKQNSNSNSNSYRASGDPAPTFTVNYPANLVNLTVKGSKDGTAQDSLSGYGTFDLTIGSTKVGEDITSYNTGVQYNSTYTVTDVRETSANYYYTGTASYTGTLTSATTVTLPFSSTTNPVSLTPTLVSRTYNSIVAKTTVSNFGAPSARTGRYVAVGLAPATATSYSGIVLSQSATNTTSTANKTFDQSNDSAQLIIAGARSFKLGGAASNTKKTVSSLLPTVYWLPPAPLASVTSQGSTLNPNDVTHTIRVIGAADDDVLNISGAKVNTEYRYSIDGGTTYTNWTTVASNREPDAVIDISLTVAYNTAVKFQARQATTGDPTQVTNAPILDIAAVAPIPPDPSIHYDYDNLNRTMTITITGGSGGAPGETSVASRDLKLNYDGGFDFVDVNITTEPAIYTISYLQPNAHLYISARTNNDKGTSSDWTVVDTKVRRPIWGVATKKDTDGNDKQVLIRDMIEVHEDGSISPRDWIEGGYTGQKRIVKN